MIALFKKMFPDLAVTAEQEQQLEAELGKLYKPAADYTRLETELASTQEQLKAAGDTLKSFEGQDIDKIRQAAKDWEDKYNTDTAKLQGELQQLQLESAADKFLSGYNFASDRVKNSVRADFLAKEFKLDGGEFVGGKAWMEDLQKAEPATFAEAEKPGVFMDKAAGKPTEKKMTLSEAMAYKNAHPDVDISKLI